MPDRPDVILFVPDQLRADALGCYGETAVATPAFDRLAAEGTRFDQAHCQMPLCTPSRCSFLTGWYPHARGHRSLQHLLRGDEPSILRALREAGYETACFGKNDAFTPAHRALALDHAAAFAGGTHGPLVDDHRRLAFVAEPFPGDALATGDARCVGAGIDWLRSPRTGGRPRALFLALNLPHPPYGCPQPWHGSVDPDTLAPLLPVPDGARPCHHDLLRRYRRLDRLSGDDLRAIRATYLGMVGYVDHLLGLLLDGIDAAGLASRTALFAFADHGDFAGDYGLVEKWHTSYLDAMTRVPLLARVPGGAAGTVHRAPVALVDLAPTVAELCGIELSWTVHGRSLGASLRGSPDAADRIVFGAGGFLPHEHMCFECDDPTSPAWDADSVYRPQQELMRDHPQSLARTVHARSNEWKLVYRPHECSELYDLRADPGQLHNRYGEPACAAEGERLRGALLNWLVTTSDVTPPDRDARGW
jgi:arylsulfatase A-like enzyme